jgi:aspartate/methionine/tyrosine aminotransferase
MRYMNSKFNLLKRQSGKEQKIIPCDIKTSSIIDSTIDKFNDKLYFNLGIPYFANEVFNKIENKPSSINNKNKYSYCTTNNALSEYVVSSWYPESLKIVYENLLEYELHQDVINYSHTFKYFSLGNTQSILSFLYACKKETPNIKVVSLGPTYFYLKDICSIVDIPFYMYNNVNDIPEEIECIYYVCSPNNPDGKIFTIDDYPENAKYVYIDCAYSYLHFSDLKAYPDISNIFSKTNAKYINFAFSASKLGLPSCRISYNIICSNDNVQSSFINNIYNCIDNSSLGFSLGMLNTTECVISFINDNFINFNDKVKNILDENRSKIENSLQIFFDENYSEKYTLLSTNYSAYVWFKVDDENPTNILNNKNILVKNGSSFFTSPLSDNMTQEQLNSYARVSIMQLPEIVDEFVYRLK